MKTSNAQRSVVTVDVGSTLLSERTKSRAFAWARVGLSPPIGMSSSQDPDLLVERLAEDLKNECSVALGFEAPLFIPIPQLSSSLSRSRSGEGPRAWSASAGLSVTSLCLHQAAWILREVRTQVTECAVTFDAAQWPPESESQFCSCEKRSSRLGPIATTTGAMQRPRLTILQPTSETWHLDMP
jgi:hypothetical protein